MEHARQPTHAVLGASAIRAQHSRLILNLLWSERDISRADLARRTNLSRSTVSAIINDLLRTGLVEETRTGVSSGGRRPILLQFQDQSSFIVGIELGATHVSCVLTDLRCRVRASWSAPAPVRDEPEVALEKMTMGVRSVLEADGVQIFIGDESGYTTLETCSVVTAPYGINGEVVGVLGVIGPTRMD